MSAGDRRLVLVVGVGRSGTSLLTGILGQLGFHIPQPEVTPDDTNPRGFGEPRWVVDFHTRLLRQRRVTVNDSRPAGWELTRSAADDPVVVGEARGWLDSQLRQGDAVVIKDPRTSWFLPLWVRCATDLGVPTSYATMLRHPAEILVSATRSYGEWQSQASRAAAWMNMSLETERFTRGGRRVFVRHEDLLADWRAQVSRVGSTLDLPLLAGGVDGARAERVDAFVDPGLHRHRVGWGDVDVPGALEQLGEEAWQRLQELAGAEGDRPEVHERLDAIHERFRTLHDDAEAIAQSTVTAARREGRAQGARRARGEPTLRARLVRRIPAHHRRMLRRALGSLRPS
jgi:hypothetical protein